VVPTTSFRKPYSHSPTAKIFGEGIDQKIVFQIGKLLDRYQEASGNGEVILAPFDVLIRRAPLRTRQPDVLYITHDQLAKAGGIPEKGSLTVAPELVVEVISASETPTEVESKLTDYAVIGVKEAWIVRRASRNVDQIRFTIAGPSVAAKYDETQTLQSLAFPDLRIAIADVFSV
jgi:Uma2 family endonuclease